MADTAEVATRPLRHMNDFTSFEDWKSAWQSHAAELKAISNAADTTAAAILAGDNFQVSNLVDQVVDDMLPAIAGFCALSVRGTRSSARIYTEPAQYGMGHPIAACFAIPLTAAMCQEEELWDTCPLKEGWGESDLVKLIDSSLIVKNEFFAGLRSRLTNRPTNFEYSGWRGPSLPLPRAVSGPNYHVMNPLNKELRRASGQNRLDPADPITLTGFRRLATEARDELATAHSCASQMHVSDRAEATSHVKEMVAALRKSLSAITQFYELGRGHLSSHDGRFGPAGWMSPFSCDKGELEKTLRDWNITENGVRHTATSLEAYLKSTIEGDGEEQVSSLLDSSQDKPTLFQSLKEAVGSDGIVRDTTGLYQDLKERKGMTIYMPPLFDKLHAAFGVSEKSSTERASQQ